MTSKKTHRRATPDEMRQINKDAEEAERLYFESGLENAPPIEGGLRQPLQADAEADPPVIVDMTEYDQRP